MRTEESKGRMKNSIGRAVVVVISILLQAFWIIWLVLKLNQYYAVISVGTSLLAAGLALRIYGKRMNSAYKMSWIVLILLFPIFGICIYLIFGSDSANALARRHFEQVAEGLKGTLPQDEAVAKELEEKDRGLYNQSWYLQHICGYPVYGDTDITYYGDTAEALEEQKKALRAAETFIFMEYHAIEDSAAWRGIEEILVEKAREGVEIRVFYDDVGSIGFLSQPFEKRLQSEGIQCQVFNPLKPILSVFMNNRDHRKITVVDGRVGFTGGYNLADEYFNLTHPYGQWKDSGIRITGKAVRSLTVMFLEMWNAAQKTMEDPGRFLPEIFYSAGERAFVQPYADSPMDKECTGENVYMNMIKNAREYVYISTPYLILDDEMQRELTLAACRGVDVRSVTPGIPDKKLIYKVTRSYYAALAARGVRIYEWTPGFLHAKQFVCDGEVAAVGTINLDFRSLYLHFENGCWFCGCRAVEDVKQDFEKLFAESSEVTEAYSKKQNPALRFGAYSGCSAR